MNTKTRWILVACVWSMAAVQWIPSLKSQPETKSAVVRVRLDDGTVVKGNSSDLVVIKTKHGLLTLPATELINLHLGPRLTEKEDKQVGKLLQDLNSENYEERDTASRELELMPPRVYHRLHQLYNSTKDSESRRRTKQCMDKMTNQYGFDTLRCWHEDTFQTSSLRGSGLVQNKQLKLTTEVLGELTIDVARVLSLNTSISTGESVFLSYEETMNWRYMNIDVLPGQSVKIRAEGKLDLWPTTPGSYVSGPAGLSGTKGSDSVHLAGSLLCKIGGAKEAVVDNDISMSGSGKLYLKIVGSPWIHMQGHKMPTGGYNVVITAE